jgi:predicted RecB family nuclease
MTRVVEIEGVGAASAQRLDAVGIKTVEALLDIKAPLRKAAKKLPKNQVSAKN